MQKPQNLNPIESPSVKALKPTIFWRISENIPASLNWVLMVLSIVIPLCLWWVFALILNSRFLPTPPQVLQAGFKLWENGYLVEDAIASITRVTIGFFLGALLAIPLGISMGSFASIRALTEPLIGILRYMPAPAFIPLFVLYLGIDEAPKIMLIFIGTLFFNTLMIMDAVKFVPRDLIETSYTLGGNRQQVLTQVIIPAVIPNIIDALRINMAAAWNLVVVAELIAAEVGLGKRIVIAQKFLRTDEIFACLIVLGLIGFAIDLSFRLLLKTTCKWAVD